VDPLTEALIELVSNTPPDRIAHLSDLVRTASSPQNCEYLTQWPANPRARNALRELISAWKETPITSAELAAMLITASAAYHRAKAEQDVELVWTGPSSRLVATRKTEQALLEVIGTAEKKLFITSFVAYNVEAIMNALREAIVRDVEISMLLESSDRHGGELSIDVIGQMRAALPEARIYFWRDKGEEFVGGKVHAKVAVCDGRLGFISSANLTAHAMEKNMEMGVLVRGGPLPKRLHDHLEALVTIKILGTT
jgi:cardiolipin synthase A/B